MFGDPGWKPCKKHKPVPDTDADNVDGTICSVCSVILSGPLDDEAKAFGKASGLVAKRPRAPPQSKDWRMCHFDTPSGDGCPDAEWRGGNWGVPVCRNPKHHRVKTGECRVCHKTEELGFIGLVKVHGDPRCPGSKTEPFTLEADAERLLADQMEYKRGLSDNGGGGP